MEIKIFDSSLISGKQTDEYISPIALRNRYTEIEKIELEMFSTDDINEAPTVRRKKAQVRQIFADMASVKEGVKLTLQKTINDTVTLCEVLESIGVVENAETRAQEILMTPIQFWEKPGFSG